MEPYVKMSKLLCLILRHKPEIAHIELDSNGYAVVEELIDGINKYCKKPFFPKNFDMNDLELIVKYDNKQRYSFNFDTTKIRANQGHSIDVDVELEEVEPPDILYHGTATPFLRKIKEDGSIKHMSRLYVHMTKDINIARINGGRWFGSDNCKILEILAKQMWKNGYKFYKSKNNVYLTKNVSLEYVCERIKE